MKKLFVMAVALGLMAIPVTIVTAGGDQNRGEIGQGFTNEVDCENQPCFEEKPMPVSPVVNSVVDQAASLDQMEIDNLLFIREEEKLARDTYQVLFEKWGTLVFARIVESEQAHTDAVANLLNYYGIEDPVKSNEVGAFTNGIIRELFVTLSALGSASEEQALLVGAYVEEYDIKDIWEAYNYTDAENVRRVYQNLYEGSYNHLRAFVYNYESLTGKKYTPKLLTETEYNDVMNFASQGKQGQRSLRKKGR